MPEPPPIKPLSSYIEDPDPVIRLKYPPAIVAICWDEILLQYPPNIDDNFPPLLDVVVWDKPNILFPNPPSIAAHFAPTSIQFNFPPPAKEEYAITRLVSPPATVLRNPSA